MQIFLKNIVKTLAKKLYMLYNIYVNKDGWKDSGGTTMKSIKKDICTSCEHIYKGVYIYRITKKDYCVWDESGMIIHAQTLKAAKAEIDKVID